MSILAAAAATTTAAAAAGDAPSTLTQVAIAAALIAAGVLIAYLLGAFAPRSVSGPSRLQSRSSVGAVFLVLVIGFVVWLGTQTVYLGLIRDRIPVNDNGAISAAALPPADMAILATLPFIIGLAVLMIGDRLAKPTLPRELAWSPGQLPRGIGLGLLAMLSVLPLMFGAGIALELFYQWVGYEHPTEHDILTVLGRSREQLTTYLIIGGATLLAPVFEEFLFRGHLQTVLVGAFSPRPSKTQGFPLVQDEAPAPSAPTAPMATPEPMSKPEPPALSPALRWAAIAITSIVFTLLHPAWTWPLIFLLSLALGYAYERTGNLWVPVVMHLVFNSVQTAFFLLSRLLLSREGPHL